MTSQDFTASPDGSNETVATKAPRKTRSAEEKAGAITRRDSVTNEILSLITFDGADSSTIKMSLSRLVVDLFPNGIFKDSSSVHDLKMLAGVVNAGFIAAHKSAETTDKLFGSVQTTLDKIVDIEERRIVIEEERYQITKQSSPATARPRPN